MELNENGVYSVDAQPKAADGLLFNLWVSAWVKSLVFQVKVES